MINLFAFLRKLRAKIRSCFKNEVYYINGTENLPPPLDPDQEEDLILDISNEKSRNILIEHNLRLVAHIVKKYYTAENTED